MVAGYGNIPTGSPAGFNRRYLDLANAFLGGQGSLEERNKVMAQQVMPSPFVTAAPTQLAPGGQPGGPEPAGMVGPPGSQLVGPPKSPPTGIGSSGPYRAQNRAQMPTDWRSITNEERRAWIAQTVQNLMAQLANRKAEATGQLPEMNFSGYRGPSLSAWPRV